MPPAQRRVAEEDSGALLGSRAPPAEEPIPSRGGQHVADPIGAWWRQVLLDSAGVIGDRVGDIAHFGVFVEEVAIFVAVVPDQVESPSAQ